MAVGFVIGNGESRKGIGLKNLQSKGPVYGCNALYRDFCPDILVALDKAMVQEIKATGYKGQLVSFPRNKKKLLLNDLPILDAPRGAILTGTVAAYLMARLNPEIEDIFLLGFDFSGEQAMMNNMYKGTLNYRAEDAQDNPRVSYLEDFKVNVFKVYPKVKFFKVGRELPESWASLDNVEHIEIKAFRARIRGL